MTTAADLTPGRDLQAVIDECTARERTAVRNNRLADAALYREVRERAEAVQRRERELAYARRTAEEDKALRLAATVRTQRTVSWAAILTAIAAALILGALLTGCASNMPPIRGPVAGAVEVGAGLEQPSTRGSNDLGDVGAYPFVQLGGAFADGKGSRTRNPDAPQASGEWFLRYGAIDEPDVDAGDLGLFDLEAEVYRLGVGLRLGTVRSLGLDWSLGLGACLTVARGEATAGPLSRDVHESGLGAYASVTAGRGPFYLGVTYIDGPEAEFEDETAQLGGLSAIGGLRWTF